jgi:hypothetical protein
MAASSASVRCFETGIAELTLQQSILHHSRASRSGEPENPFCLMCGRMDLRVGTSRTPE